MMPKIPTGWMARTIKLNGVMPIAALCLIRKGEVNPPFCPSRAKNLALAGLTCDLPGEMGRIATCPQIGLGEWCPRASPLPNALTVKSGVSSSPRQKITIPRDRATNRG
jgi:hypothetical protein